MGLLYVTVILPFLARNTHEDSEGLSTVDTSIIIGSARLLLSLSRHFLFRLELF